MAQQTNYEKIEFLASHAKADINLCVAAFQIIRKAEEEEQSKLLETFIYAYKYEKSDECLEIPAVFTDEMEKAYSRRYQKIIDGHLEELLNAGYHNERFYKELAKYIVYDKNLLDDGARSFAIYNCCIDMRLPYADVDIASGVRMDNEDYVKYIEQLGENIERVNYILNADLQQKTERASLVLKELENCDDDNK